jgi:toxin-antitoxin system PIN domain toxin
MTMLDVNVLLAIAWPNHPFHRPARQWFSGASASGWGTCQLTEAGFIRLCCNPSVMPEPCRPASAGSLLQALKRHGQYRYVHDAELSPEILLQVLGRCLGHQQVNDAFLVALAASAGVQLATYDRRLAALAADPVSVVVLSG